MFNFWDFLDNTRQKPETERQKILFVLLGIFFLVFSYIWLSGVRQAINIVDNSEKTEQIASVGNHKPFSLVRDGLGYSFEYVSDQISSIFSGSEKVFIREKKSF